MDDHPIRVKVQEYGLLHFQTEHRMRALLHANIVNGDSILELGCGQGDCTTVLAQLFPDSHITAVDPAPSDYGDPETLGQAHNRIKSYDIGSRIEFVRAKPTTHMKNVKAGAYDVAVLCHSLWYFSNVEEVMSTLEALKGKVNKLFIAEWALQSISRQGDVHVQVALARATREAHVENSTQNIRTPLSPSRIKQCVAAAGWKLRHEIIEPSELGLEDARWELDLLLQEDEDHKNMFLESAKEHIQEDRIHLVLESMIESVKSSVKEIGGKDRLECMDTWYGSFEQG